jgi:hypothetical protein
LRDAVLQSNVNIQALPRGKRLVGLLQHPFAEDLQSLVVFCGKA